MIYEDKDIGTVAEYGHGSIFHVSTDRDDEGFINVGLVSSDPGEINRECETFDQFVGKPLMDMGPMITLRFKKKESLDVLITTLREVREKFD